MLQELQGFSLGQIVEHPRFGKCEIISFDNTTYTIPMVVLVVKENIEEIKAGQTIFRPLGEL